MNETAKKHFWKRPTPYIIAFLLLVFAASFFFCGEYLYRTNTQRLNLAGYTIDLPKEWSLRLESEIAVFYASETSDEPIGKARLINQETAAEDFGKWFYFETLPTSDKQHDGYAAPLQEQHYSEGGAQYAMYVFSSLPNPQPYHFAMYFDENAVPKRTMRRILKSFFVPDPGKNPPPKNIAAPSEQELAQSAENNIVYKIEAVEQTKVHNAALLEDFIIGVGAENPSPALFQLLSFTRQGSVLVLDSWYHLDFDGEKTLLYEYYQTDSGTYSYNNNPKQIVSMERTKKEEEGLTVYQGTFSDGESCVLFEYPDNPYEERKDALYSMHSVYVGDNAAVGAILDSLPTPGLTRNSFSLQTEKTPYGITIEYAVSDAEQAYADGKLNRAPLEKNAAVIFSLVENADTVTVHVMNEEKKETLQFTRTKTEDYFGTDVRSYTQEPQTFRQYMEDVQNMTPAESPSQEQSSSGGTVGEVVYSTTVTIPHGMLVTHPRTGEKVVVDPYAERYGYAQYLGKPISCIIYRTDSGYRLVASCGGTVLAEYAMANDRDKDYVISMIHAYGG